MKITEQELIEELESIIDNAKSDLKRWHAMGLDQNTVGMGMRIGNMDTAEFILQLIKKGFDA